MDLFATPHDAAGAEGPLADRMRPQTLDEYIGQEHLVGPGTQLRRAIEADQMRSLILFGPPGTGKTTLAHVISRLTKAEFVATNAVQATVKDVRDTVAAAIDRQKLYGQKTIFFLDEVHRFSTSQQDALLPAVERGELILIGATTENPFHHVNGALLSRSTLYRLQPLLDEHVQQALERALIDRERGLGDLHVIMDDEALQHIAEASNGDIRRALNALEMAALTTPPAEDGSIQITLGAAEEAIRRPNIRADKSTQFDVLSAFHKSIRGSSDAALFWCLHAVDRLGMDPMVFLRRLIVACSEDIGLANPQAMPQAVAAMDAYHKIGWPEARYCVSQAILFAVESPKSNRVGAAIGRVQETFEQVGDVQVPLHLRDTHYSGAEKLGHVGYKYPHDYPGHYVQQDYLPADLKETVFYSPSEQGTEERIQQNRKKRNEARSD